MLLEVAHICIVGIIGSILVEMVIYDFGIFLRGSIKKCFFDGFVSEKCYSFAGLTLKPDIMKKTNETDSPIDLSAFSGRGGTINPFIDWSFKYIFGREETKDILMGFLNVLLNPADPITDITYLNNESLPEPADIRTCVFDVLCKDSSGNRFLVEMQRLEKQNIRDRLLYYACRLIDGMGQRDSQWNYDYDRVYVICMMDFTYEENPVLRSDYMLRSATTGSIFSDRLQITTLQIPCIQANSLDECVESYEKLLFLLIKMKEGMFTFEEICHDIEMETSSPEVKAMLRRVAETADKAALSPGDRAAYDYALKRYRDYYSGLQTAEEKGIAVGRDQRQVEIAKAMKTKGIDIATISECTSLSAEEIEAL